jgi:hypothetical protein
VRGEKLLANACDLNLIFKAILSRRSVLAKISTLPKNVLVRSLFARRSLQNFSPLPTPPPTIFSVHS